MNKQEIVSALNAVARAKRQWRDANRKYQADLGAVMRRLLFEAAHNYLSVEDIAKASNFSPTHVRRLMRLNGLNPRLGKRMLSQSAAKAIHENADLLGISPHEIDLTSPLAYLPMGKEMRASITGGVSKVTELPLDPTPEGMALRSIAASGNEAMLPWSYIPCAREHTPHRLCILPDGHE